MHSMQWFWSNHECIECRSNCCLRRRKRGDVGVQLVLGFAAIAPPPREIGGWWSMWEDVPTCQNQLLRPRRRLKIPTPLPPLPQKWCLNIIFPLDLWKVIWKVNKAEVGCWGSSSYQRWPHCDSIVAVVTNIFNPLCPTRRNRIVGAEHFIVHCPLWWVNAPKMFTSTRGGNINIATGETSQAITSFHFFDYLIF